MVLSLTRPITAAAHILAAPTTSAPNPPSSNKTFYGTACTSQFLWLEHPPGAGGVVQIGARRSKTSDPFVIPRWSRCRLADIGRDATTTSLFSHVHVCLSSNPPNNLALDVGNVVGDPRPPPHDMQLDASRGLLAAAARCALSHILCISPVMGLTDRKRLVQQLT